MGIDDYDYVALRHQAIADLAVGCTPAETRAITDESIELYMETLRSYEIAYQELKNK